MLVDFQVLKIARRLESRQLVSPQQATKPMSVDTAGGRGIAVVDEGCREGAVGAQEGFQFGNQLDVTELSRSLQEDASCRIKHSRVDNGRKSALSPHPHIGTVPNAFLFEFEGHAVENIVDDVFLVGQDLTNNCGGPTGYVVASADTFG